MSKDTGGNAFPVFGSKRISSEYNCITKGMTLRDYFAAHAIDAAHDVSEQLHREGLMTVPNEAEIAYRMADMMLKVRNGEEV
jgi:hypothetical protein